MLTLQRLKDTPKRTIFWLVLFSLLGFPLYTFSLGFWILLPSITIFAPRAYMHWLLALEMVSGAIFIGLCLSSALALLARHRSYLLGFAFGCITITQKLLIVDTALEFNTWLWWLEIAENIAFIITCTLITHTNSTKLHLFFTGIALFALCYSSLWFCCDW